MVSVVVWTYNHSKYIEQCLKGILDQKIDFQLEIIVGDDCSTDGAKEIIINFAQKYSNIKLVMPPQNLGAAENVVQTLSSCSGRYLAFTDGDDFWCDNLKLMKQVNFLEQNPEFNLCFHNVRIMGKGNEYVTAYLPDRKKYIDCYDLILGDFVHTNSAMVRNTSNLFKPVINRQLIGGDSILFILPLLEGGYGYYFPDIMSVYRVHRGGVYSMQSIDSRFKQNQIEALQLLDYIKDRRFRPFLLKRYSTTLLSYSVELATNLKLRKSFYYHLLFIIVLLKQLSYKTLILPYYVFMKASLKRIRS